ncbi:MAG: hypothetical protein GY701_05935, partial [Sulfitobacter sp.]|nr:hypothetical protein [Sulfitobacter sp.]
MMSSNRIALLAALTALPVVLGVAACETDQHHPTDAGDAASDAGDGGTDGDAGPVTCTDSSECTDPDNPICVVDTCEPCTEPTQCEQKPGDANLCDGSGHCVECLVSVDHCTTSTLPICDNGICTACVPLSGDCASDYIDREICLNDECVECGVSSDCTASSTVCDPIDHECRLCETHAE